MLLAGHWALLPALGCDGEPAPDPGYPVVAPEPVATTSIPYTASGSIALLSDEGTACVAQSYEVQVRCVGRDGSLVGVFGREGDGPGEFARLGALVGGRHGTVGVMDIGSNRFSVFEPAGVFVRDVLTPGRALAVTPAEPFGETVTLVGALTRDGRQGQGVPGSDYIAFEIDLASGETIRQEGIPQADVDLECARRYHAFPNPAGGWIRVACRGHLILVAADGTAEGVRSPAYFDELPREREIARRAGQLDALTRRPRGPAVRPEWLESYRDAPKFYHLEGALGRFDPAGHLWIATQRDHNEFSYLDLFTVRDRAFLGSVKVRDHMKGFDLVGSTLVVLAERAAGSDDLDGIPDVAIDWYDVSDLRLR